MTLFKEDDSVGQIQSSLRSSIQQHTFTIYTLILHPTKCWLTSKHEKIISNMLNSLGVNIIKAPVLVQAIDCKFTSMNSFVFRMHILMYGSSVKIYNLYMVDI